MEESLSQGPALRVEIVSLEAEAEGYGGSTIEGENEVWRDFPHNPKARKLDGRP